MPMFRKKPIVIEAQQYLESADALPFDDLGVLDFDEDEDRQKIKTLEGWLTVSDGDWIIQGVNGEFYPCKPDIFEKTYEPA